jgi:hypothetical protein
VLLGGFDVVAEARMKQGAPIMIIDPRQLREGSDVSSSNGAIALYRPAPHPNAAKVYINWLLSQEGQTEFVRRLGYVSARKPGVCRNREPSGLTQRRRCVLKTTSCHCSWRCLAVRDSYLSRSRCMLTITSRLPTITPTFPLEGIIL